MTLRRLERIGSLEENRKWSARVRDTKISAEE